MMKISVAMCTYNGSAYLAEQLDSIARQTQKPDELVIGDDCSSDETTEIIKDFASRVSFPVRLLVNEQNLRSTKNFEQTISRCTGDIIFLSDQDDVWLSEKIEKIATRFERNSEIGLCFSDAFLVDERLKPFEIKLWDRTFTPEKRKRARHCEFFDVLLECPVVTGATMAFRREFSSSFDPIPQNIPFLIHDEWIALIIAAQSRIDFVEEPLIKYRQHSNQQLGITINAQSEPQWSNKKRFDLIIEGCIATGEKLQNALKFMKQIETWKPGANKEQIFEKIERAIERHFAEAEHLRVRRDLPPSRIKRLPKVLKELSTNRYNRFSTGYKSALKDVVDSRRR